MKALEDFDQDGKPRPSIRLGVLFALVLTLGFVGGLAVGAAGPARVFSSVPLLGDGLNSTADESVDFTDFWKVYNVLNTRFVETSASSTVPSRQEMLYGAIQGLTASFGDPYTVFFPPAEAKVFQEDIAGNFTGVGMEIGLNKDGVLTVIAPLKNTPAERAGMQAGDLILSIDGKSTEGLSSDEAVKVIRGPKGTTVKFTLFRSGKTVELSIVRDTIEVPTIDYDYDSDTGIYTISLYTFTANSGELFNRALADMRAKGARKLILDLRGNPGGYLESAVNIASHFLPSGTTVVTEDYKGKEENVVHKSMGTGGVPAGLQMVVLVDQGSASASEILAGALQDNDVATIVGSRSFGKGSVQELITIGKAALKVTVARWLTPSGNSISDGGLTPDIAVERTSEDFAAGKDPQMQRAIEFLTTGR